MRRALLLGNSLGGLDRGTASAQTGTSAATATNVNAIEDQQFSGLVASVSLCPSASALASVTVGWGDGTRPDTTTPIVTGDGSNCTITAGHTYADEGSCTTTGRAPQFDSGGAFASPSINAHGLLHLTLRRSATIDMRVFQLLPAVQRAGSRAAARAALPSTHLVGTVRLGKQRPGRITIHWAYRVNGRRLAPGRYVLVLQARAGGKLVDVSDAIRFSVH